MVIIKLLTKYVYRPESTALKEAIMQDEPLCLKVTLEAVTPLFLGGANPRAEPELRPPSFRGALRYWLRAALGGVIGDQDINLLRKMESTVFGSTDHCSPIRIRLRHPSGMSQITEAKVLPHINGQRTGERKAFASGQKFELIMWQDRNHGEHGEEVWRAACSALVLSLTFGGVGLRSRRGYGTLRVHESSNAELATVFPVSLEDWKKHIEEKVKSAVESVRQLCEAKNKNILDTLPAEPAEPTKFPCANKLSLIRLFNLEAQSAMGAITHFMKAVPKHPALGGIRPRQSSPLWVRPIQTGDKYGLLFCVLASSFDGCDYAFVRQFLDKHFPGCDITVEGWNS